MGILNSLRGGLNTFQAGKAVMGEGIGFKGAGDSNLLSTIAKMITPKFAEPPARDTKDWLELFASSPRLDPVHKIAEDVAASDWAFYKVISKDEREKVEEHPLELVFNKPNPLPESTWYTLLYMTEAYLQLAGEAFWVLEKSGLNQIAEIWIIPPNWVDNTPTPDNNVFEVTTGDGVRIQINPEDMVYFKEPNLVSPYGRGKGRAKAIGDEIETDEYMAKWSKKFFFNDAKPPFAIEAPGANKADVERMQESWIQRFAGLGNAHKPAVLPFNSKIHNLGTTTREMDFIESRKYLRDQANQHFRVPPELMGIIENSNRATIDAADFIYKSSVLVNRLTMIQQTIQHQILNRFFESENIIFEFANVVPEDREFELKVANEGLSRGAITINEWRQANHKDMLDGDMGDVYLIPKTHIPAKAPLDVQMLIAQPTAPKEEQPADAPTNPGQLEEGKSIVNLARVRSKSLGHWKDGLTESELASASTEFNNVLSDLEKKHQKAIQKFLRKQGRDFAKYIEGQDIKEIVTIVSTKDGDEDNDGIEDILEQSDALMDNYDWIDEQNELHALMGPQMLEAAQAGNALVNGLFELGASFSLFRDDILDHINTAGLTKVVGITSTTIADLKETLIEGLTKGEGSTSLAKRIREKSDEYSYRRSFVIARTESHNTMVMSTEKSYAEAKVPKRQWLTIMDGRERDTHHDMHLEVVDEGTKFSNGLMHPGDPNGPAKEVIQCRCQLLPKWE